MDSARLLRQRQTDLATDLTNRGADRDQPTIGIAVEITDTGPDGFAYAKQLLITDPGSGSATFATTGVAFLVHTPLPAMIVGYRGIVVPRVIRLPDGTTTPGWEFFL